MDFGSYYKFQGIDTCYRRLFQFWPPTARYGDACENNSTVTLNFRDKFLK